MIEVVPEEFLLRNLKAPLFLSVNMYTEIFVGCYLDILSTYLKQL